jgi:Caspase domain
LGTLWKNRPRHFVKIVETEYLMKKTSLFLICLALTLQFLSIHENRAFCDNKPGSDAKARTPRKAVVIGIGHYTYGLEELKKTKVHPVHPPQTWVDLDGPRNDAREFIGILTRFYGFKREDILFLSDDKAEGEAVGNKDIIKPDARATRENILKKSEKFLTETLSKGDSCVFFFAGHGSQIGNSLNGESDKKDETIVPFGINEPGVQDIRDEEIAQLFNKILDTGATLTAFFDSCHSQSISRGPTDVRQRYMLADPSVDLKLKRTDAKTPVERGALVFSASLEDQPAGEAAVAETGQTYGLFSRVLIEELNTEKGRAKSAAKLLNDISFKLQSRSATQVPNLAGNTERLDKTLLGEGAGVKDSNSFCRITNYDASRKVYFLNIGLVSHFSENTELVPLENGASQIRLKVTRITGLSSSEAELISDPGNPPKVGDEFKIDIWKVSDSDTVQIWLPTPLPDDKYKVLSETISDLQKSKELELLPEPTPPVTTSGQVDFQKLTTHVFFHAENGWNLQRIRSDNDTESPKPESLGPTLTTDLVLKKCREKLVKINGQATKARIFVEVPLSKAISEKLTFGNGKPGTDYNGFKFSPNRELADYRLVGRFETEDQKSFAWVRTGAVFEASNSPSPLPPQTDWTDRPEQLMEFIGRIGRIHGWLCVNGTDSSNDFPYKLVLKADGEATKLTGESVSTVGLTQIVPGSNLTVGGKNYKMYLEAPENKILDSPPDQRYVYVFGIDNRGGMFPLFWGERFPKSNEKPQSEYFLPCKNCAQNRRESDSLYISPPFGTDVYFLLTTKEYLNNFKEIFTAPSVRTRGSRGNPLDQYLFNIGAIQRGFETQTVPSQWSVTQLKTVSIPGK